MLWVVCVWFLICDLMRKFVGFLHMDFEEFCLLYIDNIPFGLTGFVVIARCQRPISTGLVLADYRVCIDTGGSCVMTRMWMVIKIQKEVCIIFKAGDCTLQYHLCYLSQYVILFSCLFLSHRGISVENACLQVGFGRLLWRVVQCHRSPAFYLSHLPIHPQCAVF